jgi:hypothetical protein
MHYIPESKILAEDRLAQHEFYLSYSQSWSAIELEREESAPFEEADKEEATMVPYSNVFEEFFLTYRDASPVRDFR